jgi:hypothetical protein
MDGTDRYHWVGFGHTSTVHLWVKFVFPLLLKMLFYCDTLLQIFFSSFSSAFTALSFISKNNFFNLLYLFSLSTKRPIIYPPFQSHPFIFFLSGNYNHPSPPITFLVSVPLKAHPPSYVLYLFQYLPLYVSVT